MIILCKLFENRSKETTNKFLYNPQKCTLACSLGSCVQQYFSKVIIALPTQAKIVEVFEQNLIGNGIKNYFEDKRVVTKILKIDENNQYDNAMTKLLPTGE